MHQAVFALVKRGQREGVLRADLPPELLPRAITGTLHIVTRFARSRRADPDAIGAQVADLLLDGFAKYHPPNGSAVSPSVGENVGGPRYGRPDAATGGDEMFDHDGFDRPDLDYEEYDEYENFEGLEPADFSEQTSDGIASAIHGAVALLQALHTQRAAVPAALTSWTAVYGTALLEPDLGDLEDRFRARQPRTIPDAFMAGAAAMGEAIGGPTSVLISQQLAAHVRIESELVKRLAEVTGRPVHAVLAYLDEWAAAETGDGY